MIKELIKKHAYSFENAENFNILTKQAVNAEYVLLGEASHGTHEFYHARAEISKLLIQKMGFRYILIEGDWPATYKINRFIRSLDSQIDEQQSLEEFKRFPAWMWRNQEMVSFVSWLQKYNEAQKERKEKVSIFGLDLYSLFESIGVILEKLQSIDPELAQKAEERYSCFAGFNDPQKYGYFTTLYPDKSCFPEALEELLELRRQDASLFKTDSLDPYEEKFYLEQNALVVQNAERYYRAMFEGDPVRSWNLRDKHMMETFEAVLNFGRHYESMPKIIVWAHNSHLGDARATERNEVNEFNLGQLIRESYSEKSYSIGFTTYFGTVSAASHWNGPVYRKQVNPAIEGSYELLFHQTGLNNFMLFPKSDPSLFKELNARLLERAIGVIYRPFTERQSHYFYAHIADQFDAIIHFDTTKAVTPLEKTSEWINGDVPETYPFGV